MIRTSYICAFLALLIGTMGCQRERETESASEQETQDAADLRFRAFRDRMEARMRTLEKRTQNLREQAEATSGQLKTEAAREIEKIEGQLAQLQDQVQEIEPEADAAWEQAKPAIESALDRVEKWCAEIDERLRADSTERPSKQPSTEKH